MTICLPPALANGPSDERLRARLVVAVTSIFLFSSLFLLGTHALAGSVTTIGLIVGIMSACASGLLLLRLTGSMVALAHLAGFLWIATTIVAFTVRGGMASPTAMVMAGAPVIAVFIGGRRVGMMWAMVAVVAIIAFVSVEQSGVEFIDRLPSDARVTVSAIATTMFCAVMLGMVVALDAVNEAARRERDETTNRLHEAELETVRAEATAKIAHADRMASLGQLAAGIAHEVNNPLAYIVANLAFLRQQLEGLTDSDEVSEALDDVHEGAMRVSRIVGALKTFTRQEDVETERVPMNLHDTIDAAIELAKPHTQHRAQVQRDYDDDVPPILGDAHQLTQVFLNLLINAAQALDDERTQPRITVRLRRGADDTVVARVVDNGSGISPEDLHRVADPFFSTKPVGIGTGLGLSVCKGIIGQHLGELSFESEPGGGTTVSITLPAAGDELPKERKKRPSTEVQPEQLQILLIDDDPLVAKAICRMLSEHRVKVLDNGRQAVEQLAEKNPYDLVLCDLMMADVSGVDVYEKLEARSPELVSRLVFITGGACTDRAQDFIDSVPNPVLRKPFTKSGLLSAMNDVTG